MTEPLLFSPFRLGNLELKNRVVMSPLTRNRSIGNVPGDLVVTYYQQRSEAGLIVTEGTSPSPNGLGYPRIPGIFSAEQVAAWKKVTDAVHAGGAKIFSTHVGEPASPSFASSQFKSFGPQTGIDIRRARTFPASEV